MAENETTTTPPVEKRKLPSSFYNTTTMIGFGIAGITLALIIFLYILDMFSGTGSPYMGLITFVMMPPILIVGLLVGFWGAKRTHARAKRGEPDSQLPRIDFNNRRHRRIFTMFALGGLGFMAISAFGSYQVYEYTESVEFCGKLCHNVMKPEYVAYQNSPHARVTCVQCHVGSGATWYVKSKISGAYQVYSVLFDKYSRPIKTPIANLRPARETCEQCHWPTHFYSQKLVDRTYYSSDEQNTKTEMSMLMKIGGAEHGASEGIHAHMYLNQEISYIATDRERQNIPYVEAKTHDGKVIVYRSTEEKITDEMIKNGERRIVDCIDCHNRPSHRYPHPSRTVDKAMTGGLISTSLPEIKRLAVELLEGEYKTEKEALDAIAAKTAAFYKESYAKVAESQNADIQKAVKQIQQIYKTSYFPEMKVSWKAFPDNTDHIFAKGCFRCHDDKHVSADGRKITSDCNTCHTILTIGSGANRKTSSTGLEFQHPVDIGDAWKTTLCRDCHAPVEEPEKKE